MESSMISLGNKYSYIHQNKNNLSLVTTPLSTSPSTEVFPSNTINPPSLSFTEQEIPNFDKMGKKINYFRQPQKFHIQFNILKESLQINNTRKTHIDSLLKKVKSKCLKAVHEILKGSLNIIVERLPQLFITNIKIDFNKKYLNFSIWDIYYQFGLLPSYEEIVQKNLIRKGKEEILREIRELKLRDVYEIYLKSDLFKRDIRTIKEKDGEKLANLFEYVSKNMCNYYMLSKGNRKKINIVNLHDCKDENKKMLFKIKKKKSKNNN